MYVIGTSPIYYKATRIRSFLTDLTIRDSTGYLFKYHVPEYTDKNYEHVMYSCSYETYEECLHSCVQYNMTFPNIGLLATLRHIKDDIEACQIVIDILKKRNGIK